MTCGAAWRAPPTRLRVAQAATGAPSRVPLSVRLIVERVPDEPARDAAVGPPGLRHLGELGRRGQVRQAVGALDAAADPEVTDGQDVGPLELEHQEHVGAPLADPLHGGELLDDL